MSDDNAGEETVYRVPNTAGWRGETGGGSRPRAYHTNRECQYLTRRDSDVRILEVTRASAERMGLSECEACARTFPDKGHRTTTPTTCPYCGEKVRRLPEHLPCEASND